MIFIFIILILFIILFLYSSLVVAKRCDEYYENIFKKK